MSRRDESLSLIVIATGGLPVPHGKTFIGAGVSGGTGDQDEKAVDTATAFRPGRRTPDGLSGLPD